MKTHCDPIVAEVRLAGLRLAEDAQGDLHAFFENLRNAQDRSTVCAKKLAMRTILAISERDSLVQHKH